MTSYINMPTKNGYQSFHVKLLNADGGWEEVHIASERMAYNAKVGCIIAKFMEYGVSSGWQQVYKSVLNDIIMCITECQNLSISRLNVETVDRIVEMSVDFSVHSVKELQRVMDSISTTDNVDEVLRVN